MLLILYQFLSPPVCQAHCQAITEGQPWMRQMISASRSVWAVLRDLHSKAIMQIIVYSKYEYIVQERGRFLWACGWEDVCVRACICLCFGLFHKRVWGGLQETPDLETRNEFLTILVLMPFSLWSYLFSCSKGIDFTFLSSLTLTIWNDCFSSSHVTLLLIYQ